MISITEFTKGHNSLYVCILDDSLCVRIIEKDDTKEGLNESVSSFGMMNTGL